MHVDLFLFFSLYMPTNASASLFSYFVTPEDFFLPFSVILPKYPHTVFYVSKILTVSCEDAIIHVNHGLCMCLQILQDSTPEILTH